MRERERYRERDRHSRRETDIVGERYRQRGRHCWREIQGERQT